MFYPTTCVGLRYGYLQHMLSPFSREYAYPRCQVPPKGTPYFRVSAQPADLPAGLVAYALQRPIPSGRGGVTAPSGHR